MEADRVSLIEGMMSRCVLMDRDAAADGLGGYGGEWTEGAAFEAAILKNGSGEKTEGQRRVSDERFTVVTGPGVALGYRQAFKRVSDGQVFRVTGDARDAAAPEMATIGIQKASCERWVLP